MVSKNSGNILFKMFSFPLKNLSRKIKAGSLKTLSDYLFIIIEKINVKFPLFLSAYITYYEDIVDNEIHLAEITNKDNVLHIGCGSLPATSLLISKRTKAHTIGIEKNPSSVKDARYCVKVLHQENTVQIHHANALQYPMDTSTVIIVSQGIEPRYEVLTHIARTMIPETRVLFRTFSSENGTIMPQDEILYTLFSVKKTVLHPQHGLLMSILLKKKT
jgi:16S rRNA A1518/A1519 N6-dimethyltransferase RsmA/KsgA/DIM1 with predicted DNA glycosylase/AP lyase activity